MNTELMQYNLEREATRVIAQAGVVRANPGDKVAMKSYRKIRKSLEKMAKEYGAKGVTVYLSEAVLKG